MEDWTIKLHRLNGRVFKVDTRDIISISIRKEGGSALSLKGKANPVPCKEDTMEVAQLMNDVIKAVEK